MKRFFTLVAALAVALPVTAHAQAAPNAIVEPGEWVIRDSVAPLDGVRKTSVAVQSTNAILNGIGRKASAVFVLMCDGHRATIAIQWAGYLGRGAVDIDWRIDDSPVRRESATVPRSISDALFINSASATARIMDAMSGGRLFVIRVYGYSGTQDAVFDVSRGGDALNAIRAACPR